MYSYNKKNIIMIAMIVGIMLMSVGYALLSTSLNIKGISDLTGSWSVKITDVTSVSSGNAYNITNPVFDNTTMSFNVGVRIPGDKMTFTVTVTNEGDIDAYLDNIDATVMGSSVILYNIRGIQEKEILAAGQSKMFTVITEFDVDATEINVGLVKDLTITLNYIQYDGQSLTPNSPDIEEIIPPYLGIQILNNNVILDSSNLNYKESNMDTHGLYSISTNTQNNKDTYFFRGNVQNNYVSFGTSGNGKCMYYDEASAEYQTVTYGAYYDDVTSEEVCTSTDIYYHPSFAGSPIVGFDSVEACDSAFADGLGTGCYTTNEKATWSSGDYIWRIVRINEDGSVRLILDDTISYGEFFNVSEENIGDDFKSNDPVVTALNNWYNNNLSQYASSFVNSGYCYYDYATLDPVMLMLNIDINQRLFNGYDLQPQFKCDRRIQSSNGFGGQVGLLSADEAVYAGVCDSDFNMCPSYLYDKASLKGEMGNYYTRGFLTMSPVDKDQNGMGSITFAAVSVDEGLVQMVNTDAANDGSTSGIRPVINLRADLEVISGNGTFGSPYLIKTN